jgi:iron(III) transport system ATP-binding protein
MSLTLSGLTKYYGDRAAIQQLSLAVEDGEFVTLVGPSGCGKTTTLRILAGFISPDEGEVHLGGKLLSSPSMSLPPNKRDMAMVFQSFANWPHMTIFKNITYGLRLRGVPKDEIETRYQEMVRLVDLPGLRDRYPSNLSGGQQQRVALARALIIHPRVLLLDEPLSNLDARLRERMREDLYEIQRRTGITFIYVTHDQNEALSMSDHVVVMQAGRIHQVGAPEVVYSKPRTSYVASFIANCNLLPARVVRSEHDKGAMVELDSGLRLNCAGGPAFGLAPGTKTTVGLPPDRFSLTTVPTGNFLRGTVSKVFFLGSQRVYEIEAGDRTIRVSAPSTSHKFSPADAVFAIIDPGHCYMFEEESAVATTQDLSGTRGDEA